MSTSADRRLRNGLRADALCFLTMVTVFTLGSAGCTATAPNQSDAWGSEQANLTLNGTDATLRLLASGGCYGSYGNLDQKPANGAFSIPGSYTQLMGAYPGKVTYPARYTGTVSGQEIALTVTVPALQLALGPFALARGVTAAWSACAYP